MNIFIIGATSAIAIETAKLFAQEGATLFLAARDPQKLSSVATDLRIRGAHRVEEYSLDLNQCEQHQQLIRTAFHSLQDIDITLIAHGTLSNQHACEKNASDTLQEFATNCMSVISLLTILANFYEDQKKGCLAVISSVAGDRARKSNYVYGAAKGAVSLFLEGLGSRMAAHNVQVINIKPGFVDTPMTAHIKKGLLFTSALRVAKDIYSATRKPKDVVYTPWFWFPIMTTLKHIPTRLFRSLPI